MDFLKKIKVAFFGKEELNDKSPAGKLDSTDIAKVVRNVLLAMVAAGLTYLIEDPTTLAKYGPITVVALKSVLDIVQKMFKNNKVENESN